MNIHDGRHLDQQQTQQHDCKTEVIITPFIATRLSNVNIEFMSARVLDMNNEEFTEINWAWWANNVLRSLTPCLIRRQTCRWNWMKTRGSDVLCKVFPADWNEDETMEIWSNAATHSRWEIFGQIFMKRFQNASIKRDGLLRIYFCSVFFSCCLLWNYNRWHGKMKRAEDHHWWNWRYWKKIVVLIFKLNFIFGNVDFETLLVFLSPFN